MKKIITAISGLFLLVIISSCKENAQTVLVVGDSWAQFVCIYHSLDTALGNAGVGGSGTNSTCLATTRTGIRAENWLDSTFHKATLLALQDSSVKVMYLSLGGNDILNHWNKGLTLDQEGQTYEQIVTRILDIIAIYQKARPDIKILISGYDFPRFTADHPIPEYRQAYQDMGSPTPLELNSAIVRFSNLMAKSVDLNQVFYIQHYGLMHYYLGNQDFGLPPRATAPPEEISPSTTPEQIGGDIRWQSDASAMLSTDVNNGLIVDAFHLSRFGYSKLAEHAVDKYLKAWLSTPGQQ